MDVFKKAFLAGVGALSLSKEKAKHIAGELIEQGKIREQEGRALVDEMLRKADAARKDVQRTVNQQVTAAYGKMNVATISQLKKMEQRIQELERELGKKNRTTPLRPRAPRKAGSRRKP